MGKMYTLKPDESINDHVKESISLLNRLAEVVKEAYKYLPENDCTLETGVFLDIDSRAFYSAIEHVRNSIEMLDELCDELEDDKDEIRQEYEEKVVQFFNRFMNADLTDETNHRVGELNKELEQERERSNQLEEKTRELTTKFKLAKKFLYQRREEVSRLKRMLNEKYGTDILHMYPKITINNPANFCGNCCHYAQMGKNDGDFEGICTQHYIKRVDPDDASCSHFESNQVDRDKPDQPCCKACNRDDCDDCTLCPF